MTRTQVAEDSLSAIQLQATNWREGAALVLAGPGAGKTLVLTKRIARLLESTPNRRFRILALTYTNKAGDEMRDRVQQMVPDLVERTVIGTFHSFCVRLLRLHGSHLGFTPDFRIYDQDADREELLRDALRSEAKRGADVSEDDVRWLKMVDRFRKNLVSPKDAEQHFFDHSTGIHVAHIYRVYESALRENNTMDFDGMILNAHRLVTEIPVLAVRIQRSYPYWMIDEFQDITPAQFRLICLLAKGNFKNVFVVADDDQIIYQWTGAGYQQVLISGKTFSPRLIQLVENFRCPADIVNAANNLISHNFDRSSEKLPLAAVRETSGNSIIKQCFVTEQDEVRAIVESLTKRRDIWGKTAILSRQRVALAAGQKRI